MCVLCCHGPQSLEFCGCPEQLRFSIMGKPALNRGKSFVMPKKAKAAPVKKAAKVIKKPAAKETEDPPSDAVVLAAPVNNTIESLKSGVPEARDKGKSQKYTRDRDSLPPFVVDLIEQTSKKSGNARAFKSQAINRLYVRQPDGTLKLNLGDPIFKEASTVYEKEYKRTADEGYPESVMKGMFFGGSQTEFDKAVAKGEVFATNVDGNDYFAFKKVKVAREEGKNKKHELESQKGISKNVGDLLMDAFHQVGWKLPKKANELMVTNGGLSDGAQKLLGQAIASNDKMSKEASSLLKSKHEFPDTMLTELKKGYSKCTAYAASLAQLKDFELMPDGTSPEKESLDKFFMDVALHVQALNLKIEEAKGHIRAKAK